jgi:hypothetical protein
MIMRECPKFGSIHIDKEKIVRTGGPKVISVIGLTQKKDFYREEEQLKLIYS